MEKVGSLLDKYWALKRRMAVGSEPVACTRMMAAIRPYAHGMVLAGAGGGGFLFIMMKSPDNPKDKVREILTTVEVLYLFVAEVTYVSAQGKVLLLLKI